MLLTILRFNYNVVFVVDIKLDVASATFTNKVVHPSFRERFARKPQAAFLDILKETTHCMWLEVVLRDHRPLRVR